MFKSPWLTPKDNARLSIRVSTARWLPKSSLILGKCFCEMNQSYLISKVATVHGRV